MKITLFVSTLAATVSGLAIGSANIVRRAPLATYQAGCEGASIEALADTGFGGNGSDFGLDPPSGDLQLKTAWQQTYGLQSDTSNEYAFVFQVTSGSGAFDLYQNVCLINNRIYNVSFNLGVSAPSPANLGSPSGCNVVFQLNGVDVASQVPICEQDSTTRNPWGDCTAPSYNSNTKYTQHSLIFTVAQPVAKVGILFNCTANGNNAQVAVDQWRMIPQAASAVASS